MSKLKVRTSAPKPGARKEKSPSSTDRTIREPESAAPDQNSFAPAHSSPFAANGQPPAPGSAAPTNPPAANNVEIAEKIKELIRLAQEQGYLTYGDINEALPDNLMTPEGLDEIYIKLRGLEVEIVDQAEVDRIKQTDLEEEEEDRNRLDILDDPVRMYLKQMGQVPLLTREQEV
ncbi:MAG: RNA polymerase sigma factor region1.1 domain-containing protein, partial [Verrucomicrobiota bacterium]